jgi:hypothetical protein
MSNLKRVSVGIIAQDKNDNSKFVSVFLKESFPFHEGDVSSDHVDIERKGKDADGEDYSVVLQRGMSVKAEWLGDGNRVTSPNVRKGEQVDIYEVGDTGVYYWTESGRTNHLRRGETVTWAFNGSSKPTTEDVIPDGVNSYTFTVDTKNGNVSASTSMANGEIVRYDFQLNGKDGTATLSDSDGNIIQMDASDRSIILMNSSGTYVSLIDTAITGWSADTIILKSAKITLDGEVDVTGNTHFKANIDVKGTTDLTGHVTIKTSTIDNLYVKASNALNE